MINKKDLEGFLEAYLFGAKKGASLDRLINVTGQDRETIRTALKSLSDKFEGLTIVMENNLVRIGIDMYYNELVNNVNQENEEYLLSVVDEYIYDIDSRGYSKETVYGYNILMKRFVLHVKKPFYKITSKDINEFLMKEKVERGNSKDTVSNKFSRLRSFFSWLNLEEYIDRDPMKKMTQPKRKKSTPKYFTIDEIETMREENDDLFDRTLFETLYSSGIRVSEAVNLDWPDLDFSELTLTVRNGKGDKDRITFISPKAAMLLKKYKKTRKDNNPWVFQSQYKQRMSRYSMARHIRKVSERAGMNKRLTPHKLRHSFATHLLNKGTPRGVVQKLMGHSDPKTTDIYAKVSLDNIKQFYRSANL